MRARDVLLPMSTVTEDLPAREAAKVLAAQNLPGLVVVDGHGHPLTVLAGTQVLRMALPFGEAGRWRACRRGRSRR